MFGHSTGGPGNYGGISHAPQSGPKEGAEQSETEIIQEEIAVLQDKLDKDPDAKGAKGWGKRIAELVEQLKNL